MQIFIKTLTGNTITLDCDSIDNLKQQILEREGLDIDRQRLNYCGKELDAESLSDGMTVHLSSRMMGGNKKSDKKVGDALKKDIALTVLLFVIGFCFFVYPISYLIWKSMSNYTSSVTVTGAAETIQSHMRKNAMNPPIAIGIATVLGVGMYYGLRDLPATEIAILSPFILVLLFPLIMKYVYKFENWRVEPTNILFILGLIIFGIYGTFKNGDEFSRAIVLNSSIILTLSYIAQRYCTQLITNCNQNYSALDALKNSLLLTGASAVFMVSIL